ASSASCIRISGDHGPAEAGHYVRDATGLSWCPPLGGPSRADDEIGIPHGQCRRLCAVALEADLHARRAGRVERELSLMKQRPLGRAGTIDPQLVLVDAH